MNMPLTVESISAALRGSDFWLNPSSNAARIVTEAARLGYVKRLSHTQAQWTDEGLAKARAELTPPAPSAWNVEQVLALARGFGMREGRGSFFYEPGAHTSLFASSHGSEVIKCENGGASFLKPADAAEWLMHRYCPDLTASRIRPSVFKGTDGDGLAVYEVDGRVIGR